MQKSFDRWNSIKKTTDAAQEDARLFYREGEIWWVRLGKNVGYELDGKSREFTRPVLFQRSKDFCIHKVAGIIPRHSTCANESHEARRRAVHILVARK